MSQGLKTLLIILGVMAVLAVIITGAWFWFTRQAHPKTSGTIKLVSLQQPVEILRDEYGVAHIYASSTEDLFFAQGYVHAQERFWQMEFQRRTAAGRLSEIFGEATLETDRYLRHFGFIQSTESAYALLDPETKRALDAYAVGVNAYIAGRRPAQLGLEFAFLNLQGNEWPIEPWTPIDSMSWAYMMIFDQGGRPNQDLMVANMIGAMGVERFNDLRPPYRDERPTIIDSSELEFLSDIDMAPLAALNEDELSYILELSREVAETDSMPAYLAAAMTPYGAGSNSFAIAGDRTATGRPILANDPHMAVRMPALWYEIGLHCTQKNVACPYNFRGFSLPGVPGVLIGHNDRIAWGLTNAAFDAEDVYIERVNPENPNQYEVNGEWVDMEIRREEIEVRGQETPDVIFVRKTRNGVVASDSLVSASRFGASDSGTEPYALSFAWTGLEPVQSFRAIQMVIRSQNWDDFVAAAEYFEAGKQNMLYADIDGNIGYILPGKIPVRAGGDGSIPVPGWNDEFIWTGFIPFEEAPRVFNPAQGYIVTANNPQVRPGDYPYILARFRDQGQRAERITNLISSSQNPIKLDDVQAIQTDNGSISALEVIPYLRGLAIEEQATAAARDRLVTWSGQMHMDSPEAAFYNLFWVRLIANTYNDELLPDYHPDGKDGTMDSMYFILQDADNDWWDDQRTLDVSETRDDILIRSMAEAYQNGVETLGSDFNAWKWGDLHTITFRSDTLGSSGIGFIEDIFNRGPYPTSGSEAVPQKTCWNANQDFQVTCIPALRMIVDLSDLDNSLMIHSLGQSGHPMHDQYDSLIEEWRHFRYHPSNWSRDSVEAGQYERLILEPPAN
ncbi:MAG: penicillin acylase family protein [Chloroflexota bacterium]|jgi:penicillin G amidase